LTFVPLPIIFVSSGIRIQEISRDTRECELFAEILDTCALMRHILLQQLKAAHALVAPAVIR